MVIFGIRLSDNHRLFLNIVTMYSCIFGAQPYCVQIGVNDKHLKVLMLVLLNPRTNITCATYLCRYDVYLDTI